MVQLPNCDDSYNIFDVVLAACRELLVWITQDELAGIATGKNEFIITVNRHTQSQPLSLWMGGFLST